jgi:phage repressor protein C with HTH and peptisase S24 domain
VSDLKTRIAALKGKGNLDAAFKNGALQRLLGELPPADGLKAPEAERWVDVPVINLVQAGAPEAFTDLGYPARIADEYIRVPDPTDPDAFACRVCGDSMAPDYRDGDIVVFSPARTVVAGFDCFVRLEPDHDTTFKRAFFEQDESENELIRLEPLNQKYPVKRYPREFVAGLFPAIRVIRNLL